MKGSLKYVVMVGFKAKLDEYVFLVRMNSTKHLSMIVIYSLMSC